MRSRRRAASLLRLGAWDESLIEQHAEVKYLSFLGEVDAHVFPCLGDRHGCRRLMCEIRRKPGFLPAATWLIAGARRVCGYVQGVMDSGPIGAIQNVGVIPDYRGPGTGPGPGPPGRRGFSRRVSAGRISR